jgi:succinate dehydrogenase / fumarate reductase, cytochrome b subunit
MKWLINTIWTSIGKKVIMAITGLCFCGFLLIHLIGNLTLYGGKNYFNNYVEMLHSLGPLVLIIELILLILAIFHVTTGLFLFYENYTARPVKYQYHKSSGGRTIGSATMPYTGLFLLLFLIIHIWGFFFTDHTGQTVYQIISNIFSNPVLILLYIIASIMAATHISHGFWSAFQTIGANHPKYMPLINAISIIFSITIGIGFGIIPIYISILT